MHEEEQAPPPQEAAPASIGPEGAAAPEISRRVGSILDAVEREAARLREEARVEAGAYLDNARRRADGLVAERQRRIGEISDELIAKSEAVIARLDDAAPVRMGFENLVRALGDVAERLAPRGGGDRRRIRATSLRGDSGGAAVRPTAAAAGRAAAPPRACPGAAAPLAAPAAPSPAQPLVHHAPDPLPATASAPAPAGDARLRERPTPGLLPGGAGAGNNAAPGPASDHGAGGDEARMVAIQMAASGATRGTVREHPQRTLARSAGTGP